MNNIASSTGAPGRRMARDPLQFVRFPVLVVVGIWALGGFAAATAAESHQTSTIGDSSGYVNSLFSTLALVGVIIAIVLQSQELKLQREELRATREEMNRSTSARQKSEQVHAQQVRFLFLATYLNGLNQAIGCYDEMQRTSEPGCSQNRWLFKLAPLKQEVASLVERLRPFAAQLLTDSPASGEHIAARLAGCTDYLRGVPAGDIRDPRAWHVVFDDVTEELMAVATLAAHVSTARNAILSECDHLKHLQKSLPKEGEFSAEHVKAIEDAIQHFEVVRQAVSIALAVA